MKKHAFLILAHNQPSLVCHLVRALSSPSSETFIHIDRKSECDFGELPKEIRVISTQTVRWGGIGMVQATLDLLVQSTKCQRYETYTLLSGSDFPIKSISEIIETLNATERNRIDYWHDEDISWHKRYQRYFFNDVPGIRGRVLNALSRRFAKILPKRKFYRELKPYFGSQWWTLTRSGVESVLSFNADNPGFARYCQKVHIPDEMFFHTILLNVLGEEQMKREPLRYLDWADKQANPKILDESDETALRNSNALFARKFDENRSQNLLLSLKLELGYE